MTTIQLALTILGGLGLIAALILLVLLAAIYWVARGESDVNGDPERDAGLMSERDSEFLLDDPTYVRCQKCGVTYRADIRVEAVFHEGHTRNSHPSELRYAPQTPSNEPLYDK